MATSLNQDDYLKTALRLPRDLHAKIQQIANDSGRSMNAEIVERLTRSFEAEDSSPERIQSLEQSNQQLSRALETMARYLADMERGAETERKFDQLFRENLSDICTDFDFLVDDLREVLEGDSNPFLELDNLREKLNSLNEFLKDIAPIPEDPQQRLFT